MSPQQGSLNPWWTLRWLPVWLVRQSIEESGPVAEQGGTDNRLIARWETLRPGAFFFPQTLDKLAWLIYWTSAPFIAIKEYLALNVWLKNILICMTSLIITLTYILFSLNNNLHVLKTSHIYKALDCYKNVIPRKTWPLF